jgi:anti-sigma factor RsiW
MRSRDDSELQRYHDGELSPRRARRVRQWLERDPLARQRRDSLQQLHELVASGAEGRCRRCGLFPPLAGRCAGDRGETGRT